MGPREIQWPLWVESSLKLPMGHPSRERALRYVVARYRSLDRYQGEAR